MKRISIYISILLSLLACRKEEDPDPCRPIEIEVTINNHTGMLLEIGLVVVGCNDDFNPTGEFPFFHEHEAGEKKMYGPRVNGLHKIILVLLDVQTGKILFEESRDVVSGGQYVATFTFDGMEYMLDLSS